MPPPDYVETISTTPITYSQLVRGVGVHFLTIPDLNGSGITLPTLSCNPEPGILSTYPGPKIETAPSPEFKEIFAHCLIGLRLPVLISAYLAGKYQQQPTSTTLESLTDQFGVPGDDTDCPTIITVGGPSNMGKSIFVALAEVCFPKVAVASLAGFSSPDSLTTYSQIIGEIISRQNRPNIEELVLAINQYWQEHPKHPNGTHEQNWNLTQALDRFCLLFANGNRPPVVLLDMPGIKLDKDGHPERSLGPFDALAQFATEHLLLTRHRPDKNQSLTTDPDLDWRVIGDYLHQFSQQYLELTDFGWLRTQMFVNWSGNNLTSFCQYYQEWQLGHLTTPPNPSDI